MVKMLLTSLIYYFFSCYPTLQNASASSNYKSDHDLVADSLNSKSEDKGYYHLVKQLRTSLINKNIIDIQFVNENFNPNRYSIPDHKSAFIKRLKSDSNQDHLGKQQKFFTIEKILKEKTDVGYAALIEGHQIEIKTYASDGEYYGGPSFPYGLDETQCDFYILAERKAGDDQWNFQVINDIVKLLDIKHDRLMTGWIFGKTLQHQAWSDLENYIYHSLYDINKDTIIKYKYDLNEDKPVGFNELLLEGLKPTKVGGKLKRITNILFHENTIFCMMDYEVNVSYSSEQLEDKSKLGAVNNFFYENYLESSHQQNILDEYNYTCRFKVRAIYDEEKAHWEFITKTMYNVEIFDMLSLEKGILNPIKYDSPPKNYISSIWKANVGYK